MENKALYTFGDASASTDLPLDRPAPEIMFDSRSFCFTGKFIHGTRAGCQSALTTRGAAVQSSPTRDTHYLVIGGLAAAIGSTPASAARSKRCSGAPRLTAPPQDQARPVLPSS